MPVFIYEPDAFEKMVKVEGEEYRRVRTKEEFGICSFDAFLEEWKKLEQHPNFKDFKDFRPEFGIGVEGNHAIYGWWGWNRYIVLNSGEMVFHSGFLTEVADEEIMSERHRYFMKGDSEKARDIVLQWIRKIGFRIFPDDLRGRLKDGKAP